MSQLPGPTSVTTRRDFGRALTAAREQAGLSVRDVARITGLSTSTVGDYFSGRHLPPARSAQLANLLRACQVTDPGQVAAWADALARVRRAPGPRPAGALPPYRGLEGYRTEDAEWFFGRDDAIETVVSRVQARSRHGGLIVVVGPSGSGKSSLLRAGVIPALRVRHSSPSPPPERWQDVLLTPGQAPLPELTARLPGAAGNPAPPGTTLLVIDQFEEIFAPEVDAGQREALLDTLLDITSAAADVGGAPAAAVVAVLGLRADFYPAATRCPQLVAALQDSQVVLGPMTVPQLRSAIVQPARSAHLDLEEGLVEVLLADLAPAFGAGTAGHEAGALPLLSHALLTTWQRGPMTVVDYRATGGIQGAIATTAEEVYADLTAAQQRTARRLFGRLVTVNDDAADTRRRVRHDELARPGSDAADLQQVLDRFIARRLVTADADTVTITHEALLTAWPRLVGWIDADRAGLRVHRQLTVATRGWQEAGADPDALYAGVQLEAAREWVADPSHAEDLNPAERHFVQESIARQDRERAAVQRRSRRLRQLVAALVVLLLVAVGLSGYAFRLRDAAATQRDLALSRQVAEAANRVRANQPALAAQLAQVAYRISPTAEARAALLDSSATPTPTRLLGPPGVMQALAASPDGRIVAAAGQAASVRLWSRPTRTAATRLVDLPTGDALTVFALAFSPDGHTLAAAGADSTVHLWNVADPAHPSALGALIGPGNTVYGLAFSPDGRTLVAGSADQRVYRWNVADPAHPTALAALTGPTGYVQAVAFSPDGRTLVAGSVDQRVYRWNVADPARPTALAALTGPTSTVFSVAVSPDGHTLAAGSRDGHVYRWDTTDPAAARPLDPLTGPGGWINSLAFSPDGRELTGGATDDLAWTWDLATGTSTTLAHPGPVTAVAYVAGTLLTADADATARLWPLPGPRMVGPPGSVYELSFTRDAATLAASSNGGGTMLWNVTDPSATTPRGPALTGPADPAHKLVGSGAITRDGRTVATGGNDGVVRLWDVSDPARPTLAAAPLTGGSGTVEFVAFSPDGHTLAAGGDDTAVRLWDVSDPHHPVATTPPLLGADNYVFSVAFSPDGHTLAAGGADNSVVLWDVSDPYHPARLAAPLRGATSYVFSVAFSPDGRTLAAGSADRTVRLWNVADRRHPTPLGAPLTGPTNYVNVVAFSPDGRSLAAGSEDGTIWLYDLTPSSGPRTTATLTATGAHVLSLAFSPDGHTLAAGSTNQVRLWDVDPARVASRLCSSTGDAVTRTEWALYVPGVTYRAPCGAG